MSRGIVKKEGKEENEDSHGGRSNKPEEEEEENEASTKISPLKKKWSNSKIKRVNWKDYERLEKHEKDGLCSFACREERFYCDKMHQNEYEQLFRAMEEKKNKKGYLNDFFKKNERKYKKNKLYFFTDCRDRYYKKTFRFFSRSQIGKNRNQLKRDLNYFEGIFERSQMPTSSAIFPIACIPKEGGNGYDVHVLVGADSEKGTFLTFGGNDTILPLLGDKEYGTRWDRDLLDCASRETQEELCLGKRLGWKHEKTKNPSIDFVLVLKESEPAKYYPAFIMPFEKINSKADMEGLINDIKGSLIKHEEAGEYAEYTNYHWLNVNEDFYKGLKDGLHMSFLKHKNNVRKNGINSPVFGMRNSIGVYKNFQNYNERPLRGSIEWKEEELDKIKESSNFNGKNASDRNAVYGIDMSLFFQLLAFEDTIRECRKTGISNMKLRLTLT